MDRSITVKGDPKTKELQRIISSFTTEGSPTSQQEIRIASEQDKESAYQVVGNESSGKVDYFIRFSKANVKISYSIDSRNTKLSSMIIENFEKEGDRGTNSGFDNDMQV